MRKIILGRTGRSVSAVSFGTWAHGGPNSSAGGQPIGWSGHDDRLAEAALIRAWELGINHWDTADVYGEGNSEQLIGRAFETVPREEIFLASKVGWNQGDYPHYYHPTLMRKRLERTLQNLRVDMVDLFYFHHCLFGKKNELLEPALEAMLQFREEGKIQFIGLSDWNCRKIMKVVDRINPDVIQPYRNVRDDDYAASGLRQWINDNNTGVVFFSPLRHGLLTGKYNAPATFTAGDFRSGVPEFRDAGFIARTQTNRRLLEERFATHPQPVLHGLSGALLTDAPTGCVLLGQRNPQQVEAAATLGEPLSAAESAWVFSLYQ
ncbi:MAG: aldo/keto reductase [Candidatus Neomarinimicrobiota bacterium]